MKHLILVGACYVDTILSVPSYPGEDDKLRATAVQVRRGGNCPNSLEVLQQLLGQGGDGDDEEVMAHLVACLPERGAPATTMILDSFQRGPPTPSSPNCDLCLFRDGHATPASSYIMRSAATGSRTIVNHSELPEMTEDEFKGVVARFRDAHEGPSWWHFEGRVPETTLACIRHLNSLASDGNDSDDTSDSITVSVEVEKPRREGLRALAASADVVFYSKAWAQDQGYASAEACLRGEAESLPSSSLLLCTWGVMGAAALVRPGARLFSTPAPFILASTVVDTVGSGDTFVAGILYKLLAGERRQLESDQSEPEQVADDTVQDALSFAVRLATRKVQIDGFQGLV